MYFRRWIMKIAFSDPMFAMPIASYLLPQYNCILGNSWRIITKSFLIVFPVYFVIALYAIPELTEYDLLSEITVTFFLFWLLILYLTTVLWFWYKRKCDRVVNRENVKRIKKILMKRLLKLFPYYLLVHVLFFSLFNILLLIRIKLDSLSVAFLIFCDILIVHIISVTWIRIATYPLRSQVIRTVVRCSCPQDFPNAKNTELKSENEKY